MPISADDNASAQAGTKSEDFGATGATTRHILSLISAVRSDNLRLAADSDTVREVAEAFVNLNRRVLALVPVEWVQ